jgi:TonB family protein
VRYLENELHKRSQLGKAASIAGISLGIASTFAACNTPQQQANTTTSEQEIRTEVPNADTVSMDMDTTLRGTTPELILPWVGDIEPLDGIVEPLLGDIEPLDGTVESLDGEILVNVINAVEIQPEFPGGEETRLKFLKNNMIYPKEAIEKGIEGTVYVEFMIEKDGSISNVKVARGGIGGGCDEEAVRVISMMPNWKPGKRGGEDVQTRYILPIHFKLDDK